MDPGTKLLLFFASLCCCDLQAAEEDVAESKITERREHKRRKREQFCDVWCLPNWALYNYTCYRVLPGLRTWVDAEVYCQNMVPGGHLASLHSLETSEFLADLSLNTLNSNMVWVGASDKYKAQIFFWTDGSQWDYFLWQSNYPTVGLLNHHCVLLQCVGLDAHSMSNADCSQSFAAVCEYKPEFD
ncbi:lectin-like [Leucoraja erinacea]|uniref:lectin-like n=1 Tax=Leucoraja erinaceus TaxID=7782 RepID=UPI002454FDB9|nr:lectin-like [Leucoraja erinacea]